jgi:hypothetical protein
MSICVWMALLIIFVLVAPELLVVHRIKQFSVVYGSERFITMFTRARHWFQS